MCVCTSVVVFGSSVSVGGVYIYLYKGRSHRFLLQCKTDPFSRFYTRFTLSYLFISLSSMSVCVCVSVLLIKVTRLLFHYKIWIFVDIDQLLYDISVI